mmetsp:Transcript_14282/g.40672  ORF Transcript_14282/g.40672 Transcript_14282/m.40672 type:complete len:252 (+) Transcript_14282:535-1290(+)
MQVVVHEDVSEPLLGLAPGAYHLPDVQQGCYPRAIVENVSWHVERQPRLWHRVVQEPREGCTAASSVQAAAAGAVFRGPGRPRPDAAAAVVGDPYEALLLLVSPLEAGIAAAPLARLPMPNSENSVARIRMVDEGREYCGELVLFDKTAHLRAFAHDNGVPYRVQPVPTDELVKPIIEGLCSSNHATQWRRLADQFHLWVHVVCTSRARAGRGGIGRRSRRGPVRAWCGGAPAHRLGEGGASRHRSLLEPM